MFAIQHKVLATRFEGTILVAKLFGIVAVLIGLAQSLIALVTIIVGG